LLKVLDSHPVVVEVAAVVEEAAVDVEAVAAGAADERSVRLAFKEGHNKS
jgi:hypothetical protein